MKKLLVLGLSSILTFSTLLTLTSCGGGDTPFEEKVYPEKVDYVSSLKFDKNSGRKYVKVSTKLLIDGDTTHFYISKIPHMNGYNPTHRTFHLLTQGIRYPMKSHLIHAKCLV